jgi:hypothetical protein
LCDAEQATESGRVPRGCSRFYKREFPWWVVLILGAAEYAKEVVIVVLPDDCVLPAYVEHSLRLRGKTVHRVSLSSVSSDVTRKLQMYIDVVARFNFKTFEESSAITKMFEKEVNRFWK